MALPVGDCVTSPTDAQLYEVGDGDLYSTTLGQNITPTVPAAAATLTLASVTVDLPTNGLLLIDDGAGTYELIKYEGVNVGANTVTVDERGFGGTSGITASTGDTVKLVVASYYHDLLAAYIKRLMVGHLATGIHDQNALGLASAANAAGEAVRHDEFSVEHNVGGTHSDVSADQVLLTPQAGVADDGEGLTWYDNTETGFHQLRYRGVTHKTRLDPGGALLNRSFPVSYGGANFLCDVVFIPTFVYDGITYGGFWAGKFGASQPNATPDDDNPDVADNADPGTCPAISQPGVASWRYVSLLRARKAAANLGVGWHLLTTFEDTSLARWAWLNGTMPHGNNNNSALCNDSVFTGEAALPDRAALARNAVYYASLPGTGPNAWAHNHRADGVFDLNGNMWEWRDGLLLCPASLNDNSATPHVVTGAGGAGYPLILANLEVALNTSPYGKSTAVAAGSLTDSVKAWTVNAFAGCFLYDVAGSLFYVDSNTATALTVDGASTPIAGAYTILKVVAVDITSGMSTGNRILTLRDADADLKAFNIPATSDGTGSSVYGNDGYWFSTSVLRAAVRGGDWNDGVKAGVFASGLYFAPSNVGYAVGLRVGKSI